MAGMLEWLLANHFGGPSAGQVAMPPAIKAPDEAALAEEERLRAAGEPLPGLWERLNRRPAGSTAPPDGGWVQPDSFLGRLTGAAAAPVPQMPGTAPIPGLEGMGMLQGGIPDVPPPSTNDPLSGEPVLARDVPLPRPRPSFDSSPAPASESIRRLPEVLPLSMAPEDDRLPPNAAPTIGRNPVATRPMPGSVPDLPVRGGEKSILDRIFDPDKTATYLALGAGFSGAGSIGTGMRRAFSNAVPAMAADRAHIQKRTTIADTYRALVAKGVPPADALAASQNPDIMKTVAAKYFETKPRQHMTIKDAIGGERPVSFDPNTGKYFEADGREIKSGDDATGGGAPGGVLAPGVKFDPDATGQAYFDQFNKDIQAAAKAYINGDVVPSGNPRQKALATFAKTVAQRYGQDMGIPVSDASYNEKRKYRLELGSASASTAGGQAKAFNQGIEHADSLAKLMEKLGNVDPVGIPAVSHGLNWMWQKFSTKQAGIATEAAAIGQTLAGEVGKLFSGAQGGGVHERELTRQRFNTITSPSELAGAMEATLETMEGGLRALEQRRDQVMGPNNNVTLVPKETHEKIAAIRQRIKRLRGDTDASPAAAAPAGAPAPGNYVYDPASKRLVPAQ